MKQIIYYGLPILIITMFFYLIGAIKAWNLDPQYFGCKTRTVLAACWGIAVGYAIFWQRIKDL